MQQMQDVDMLLKPIAVLLVSGLVITGDTSARHASTSRHTVLVRKNTALKFSAGASRSGAGESWRR
jgi:hypothetical protein